MKTTMIRYLAVVFMLAGAAVYASDKAHFSVKGLYVEGCSCTPPCACDLLGLEMGCQGVGAMELSGGKFNGVKLSGARLAYAVKPGHWLCLYVDAVHDEQREAALEFAKAYYKDWGKLESAKPAHIKIEGKEGNYTLSVDEGKIMMLKTEPVLGGDGKTAIKISNTKSGLNSTFSQGRTLSCTFKDGDQSFEFKDSNAYFNPKMKAEGDL